MGTIHTLQQGSEAWRQFRSEHFGASEAAAMLGISKYASRSELLRRKATGIEPEISPAQQAVFDRGHETEIGGRAMAEQIIGEDLFPVTCSDGKLSASCDGLTLLGGVALEHKQWNEALAASVLSGVLPDEHQPQCQQIMLVTGAERVLFMVSDGTPDKCVHLWAEPDATWQRKITQGWAMFEADLAAYQHTEVKPEAVADYIEALPALIIQVEGKVLATNLDAFKEKASQFIASIKTELFNDQDFVDADKMVKFLGDGEKQLALVKQQAQAQAADIDAVFRAIDTIAEQMRQKRLQLEKLVKAEKENRRTAIIVEAKTDLGIHLNNLNKRIGMEIMPDTMMSDGRFANIVKGLKSLSSMKEAVNTVLLHSKLEASELADRIEANKKTIDAVPDEYAGLFADLRTILMKDADDLKVIVQSRIADHKLAIEKRMEAERLAAERLAEDQRGKTAEATHAVQQATERPQAPAASTLPTTLNARIDQFFASVNTPKDKQANYRAVIMAWEAFNGERQ